jgi:hypothetical protein
MKITYATTTTAGGVEVNGSKVIAIQGINIDNFDAFLCKNVNLKIKLYKTGFPAPLDLYTQEDSTPSNQVWLSVDKDGIVSLLDTTGRDLSEFGDSAIGLSRNLETGRYLIEFFSPLQPADNVNLHTVESGPNAPQ